jgi:hypothetical protein
MDISPPGAIPVVSDAGLTFTGSHAHVLSAANCDDVAAERRCPGRQSPRSAGRQLRDR